MHAVPRWGHMSSSPALCRRYSSCCYQLSPALLPCSPPLLKWSVNLQKKKCGINDPFRAGCSEVSYSLCLDWWHMGDLYWLVYTSKRCFSNERWQIYAIDDSLLGVRLILNLPSKILVVNFPWVLWSVWSFVIGPIMMPSVGFILCSGPESQSESCW